jgi:enterochelin esterase family protein
VEKLVENLKNLRLLYLDAGTKDEFALDLGARHPERETNPIRIPHLHEEFDDGHF